VDTEHKFKEKDAVRFKGDVWLIRNYLGNKIYSVYRANSMRPWLWEFAYEDELTSA
jgi:hypothetical protein